MAATSRKNKGLVKILTKAKKPTTIHAAITRNLVLLGDMGAFQVADTFTSSISAEPSLIVLDGAFLFRADGGDGAFLEISGPSALYIKKTKGNKMEIREDQFFAGDLLTALTEAGFNAIVEQTGGGTATIFARKVEGDNQIVGGPGRYNWKKPAESVFTTEEFFVGEDAYDNEGEQKDHDPDSVMSKTGDDVPALVKLFIEEYAKINEETTE